MAKKDLPFDTIKVLYQVNKLIPVESRDADKREIQGQYHAKEQEIDYDQSLRPDEKANTILHEVLHALVYTMSIKFKDHDQEESVVNSMSNGIITVLKDNPDFLGWLKDVLTEPETTTTRKR